MAEPTAAADNEGDGRVYDGTELEWIHDWADCMRQAGSGSPRRGRNTARTFRTLVPTT